MRSILHSLNFLVLITLSIGLKVEAKDLKPLKQQSSQLSFIENLGQVTDQNYIPRKDIDVKLTAGDMNIFVGEGEIHYQWIKNPGQLRSENNPQQTLKAKETDVQHTAEIYRMDVMLLGANKNAQIIKEERQAYCENYYLPQYKGTVSSFNRITYQNIYNNIDWVLYTENNQLKYDFIVHPGGNPADIKLQYKGAIALDIKDGAVIATTPYGSLTEHKPYSYDAVSKQEIPSSYLLTKDIVAFDIAVRANHDIVIDPLLQWATYYSGTSNASILDVAANSADDAFICGYVMSTGNIATTGAHKTTYSGGNSDAFVTKFNTYGSRLWATYYGGQFADYFSSVALDSLGYLYLGGESGSDTGIATSGAHQTTYGGEEDGILVKMSSNGSVIWGTYFGGAERETGKATVDANGNVYLIGETHSAGIATSGAYKTTLSGSYDAYIAKFNSSGVLQWASYFGGEDEDWAFGVDCDNNGNVYMTGGTRGSLTGIATTGAHQTSQGSALADYHDGFLCKWNSSGSLLWSTYYGGRRFDYITAVACDAAGSNVYVTGYTMSADGIATSGSYQSTNTDTMEYHGFLAKFNSSGVRQWGTYYAGNSMDNPGSIDVSPEGNILFSSFTYSSSGIAMAGSHQTARSGTSDYFIAEFTPSGVRNWASYFGGTSYEAWSWGAGNAGTRAGGGAMTTSPSGKLYFVGGTYSNTGIATPGAFQTTTTANNSVAIQDGFLTSWVPDTLVSIDRPFTDTALCAGQLLNIRYSVTLPFRSGNIFTAQLSNASGSFSSPVNIGFKADTDSGTIVALIPFTAVPGSGYRIRVVASNPLRTSEDNGVNIRIKPRPIVSAGSNSPICEQDTLKLVAVSTTVGSITYYWAGPDSFFSTQQNPIRVLADSSMSGAYIVAASLNGCYGLDTTTVIVRPKPIAPVASSNSPVCIGNSLNLTANSPTPGVYYEWAGPLGFFSVQQNPTITNMQPARAGTYTVKAFLYNCASTPTSVNVVVINCPAAVNNIAEGTRLSLYPNPNKGNFTITGIYCSDARIEIMNALGQLMYLNDVKNITGSVGITTPLQPGVYFIKIHGNNNSVLSTSFTVTD